MSNNKNLSFDLVFVNGALDRAKSIQSATSALDVHIAKRHTEYETIQGAVNAVFDKYRGTNITMPTIKGMISRELNCNPDNFEVLTKLALDYVRENAGKRETGALFGIQKGKGKGVVRWADVPVEAPKPGTSPAATVQPASAEVDSEEEELEEGQDDESDDDSSNE